MSLKMFQLFKIINPPLIPPFLKGEGMGILNRGILICFTLSSKKTYDSKRKY
jgi:hypothetical protein